MDQSDAKKAAAPETKPADNSQGEQAQTNGNGPQETAAQAAPQPTAHLKLTFGPLNVTAMLGGKVDQGMDPKAVQRSITELLKAHGVRYGLDSKAVRQAIGELVAGKEVANLVIARGQAPSKGSDAAIETLIDLGQDNVGRQGNWGHIDFRDKGPLPVAKPEQPLARLIPAKRGAPGKDVLGRRLTAPPVRMLRLRPGKGVTISEDGRQVIAAIRGIVVRPEEEKFQVLEVLEVDGDVDFETGHIEFPGMVKVSGAVLTDFKVTAAALEAGTLEVGAIIELDGDLTVDGGIMGAEVKAGGTVRARFVRDSRIECAKDLVVENEIVQSTVRTAGGVQVSSGDGRIVNSRVSAVMGLTTQEVRSASRHGTVITLGVQPEMEKEMGLLFRTIKKLTKEREDLTELVTGQDEELTTTEQEIRSMIESCRTTTEPAQRDNLLTQIQMLMPLRDTLKEGVDDGRRRLQDLICEKQRLEERLFQMRSLAAGGRVWAEVRGEADAGTEFRGPRSSLILESTQKAFSVGESPEIQSDGKPSGRYVMKVGPIRAGRSGSGAKTC